MNIIKLNAIDSTNSYLKALARKTELEDKTAVLTHNQTSGRGQRDNPWFSKSGESLTVSMFKRFESVEIKDSFKINMAVSLAVYHVLNQLNIPQVSIKWSNDILSANKKLGGILIENVLSQNRIKHAVIGIGLNVNIESFENLSQAGSMKLHTGQHFDLDEVAQLLLKSCFEELDKVSTESFQSFKTRYEAILFRKNVISEFESADGNRFFAEITGISDRGELLIKTSDGMIKQIQVKELKLIY